MTFRYSPNGLQGRERVLQRIGELLPGATSWAILLGMMGLAWWKPLVAAILIITFDLYWLLRLFYMTFFLVLSYVRLSIEQQTDWMARVAGLDRLEPYLQTLEQGTAALTVRQRLSAWFHHRQLRVLQRRRLPMPPSEAVYHVIIIPIAKESGAVLEPGLESLIRQPFPTKRMLVVLAVEARARDDIKAGVSALQERYRVHFLDLLVVVHPDGLPGEAKVKGANTTWAAQAATTYFKDRGIPFEHIIASCFDADTIVSSQYFACLTYCFLTCPDRTQASFQPIPVYHNNIWNVPGFARVLDIGSSFFQLIEATNPDRLVTFSSHSMSFQALVEVGYWPVDMISDDSAIFWKAFIHFDGRYRVIPMQVTVSMDVVSAPSWWKTITSVYTQKRRWAWGVENVPIVMRAFLKPSRIPYSTRLAHAGKLFEGHIAWASWGFLLTVISWFIVVMVGREFSDSVLYYSAPRITTAIFSLASLSLLTTIVLSLCLLPKQWTKQPLLKTIGHAFEWLLVPGISMFLSALPALDAQTRLMCGRSMAFWVTEKVRT